MDYEKLYKEALERARTWKYKSGMPKDKQGILDDIFPELCESKDKRIRKAIYSVLKYLETDCSWDSLDEEVDISDAYDWLEKQGNQREQLINKACNVLVDCIEDFMLRRMEMWDEECKKQTLENIRKKLEE